MPEIYPSFRLGLGGGLSPFHKKEVLGMSMNDLIHFWLTFVENTIILQLHAKISNTLDAEAEPVQI